MRPLFPQSNLMVNKCKRPQHCCQGLMMMMMMMMMPIACSMDGRRVLNDGASP
jgi:hypothetical protein